jgi:hypothetical protein
MPKKLEESDLTARRNKRVSANIANAGSIGSINWTKIGNYLAGCRFSYPTYLDPRIKKKNMIYSTAMNCCLCCF